MMKKGFLAVLMLTLAVGLAACGSSDGGDSTSAKAVKSDDPNATELKIVASNWDFDQTEYVVKKGEPVKFVLHNEAGMHTIDIPKLGIKLKPDQAQTYVINEAGTYDFHCDTVCGAGHADMKAKIIVE